MRNAILVLLNPLPPMNIAYYPRLVEGRIITG